MMETTNSRTLVCEDRGETAQFFLWATPHIVGTLWNIQIIQESANFFHKTCRGGVKSKQGTGGVTVKGMKVKHHPPPHVLTDWAAGAESTYFFRMQ